MLSLVDRGSLRSTPGDGGVPSFISSFNVMTVNRAGGAGAISYTPCPNPTDIQSCLPLLQSMAAPLRDEIIAFIKQAKPEVDAIYARVNQAGSGTAAAPAAPSGSAGAVTQRLDLETLPVGALFAAADEAAAKGDKAGARAALRALIRRFPDHALAATAAKQLSAL